MSFSKEEFKKKFKDNWNKEDIKCEHCGNITLPAIGITRQNVKRLLSFKANISDFMTLIMIAMVILAALAYNDMKAAKEKCEAKFNVNAIQNPGNPGAAASLPLAWAYNQTINPLPNITNGKD